jgi:thiosulfate/3-mercaptopyruvate sulfurtransferase
MSIPTPLVSTQWLADHLGADDLLVIDASVLRAEQPNGRPGYVTGHEVYLIEGHIPGAVFADQLEEFADPEGRFALTKPDAARFAAAAGALGIGPDTTVIVYDRVFGQWASRFWWLLRAFGFDNAAVLDGGWTKWTGEERPTETGHIEPAVTAFPLDERPELWASKSEIEAVVAGDRDATLISANTRGEFTGEEGKGHIPGSLNVPLGRLLDRDSNTLLAVDALAPLFGDVHGRAVTYCNSGIAAAADALALVALGYDDVAVYDGSLAEWSADPDAPLTTGSSQTKSVHA